MRLLATSLLFAFGLTLQAADAAVRQPVEIRVEPEIAMAAAPALAKRGRGRASHPHAMGLAPPTAEELGQIQPPKKGKPPQIGFDRRVASLEQGAESALQWESVDGVLVAAIAFNSPGAVAVRIGLEVKALPTGALVRFHDDAGEALFEVHGEEILAVLASLAASGETGKEARTWWSPILESEWAVMEIELPAGVSTKDVRISIPRVSHLVASAKTGFAAKAAAACNNDATCQLATWSAQMNAVSRMIFQDGGSFACTGTLLADTDLTTTIPYFLTANHCIDNLAAAQSIANYWFYRSTACNSGTPGAYVQQSAGSGTQLLYNSTNTDVSFLRLGNTPPAGTTYAGWRATPGLSSGNGITALHHPTGDLLKLSTGSVAGFLNCTPPDSSGQFSCSTSTPGSSRFYEVDWTSGITQGGSSGSAIFDSGKYVVGQLYGGGSSCSTPTDNDIYGRFDVSYSAGNLAQFLSPGPPPAQHALTVTKGGTNPGSGTVTSSVAGITCGATCNASFLEGTVVTLTATPVAGVSTFAGWSGACTGEGLATGATCNVTMSAAANVTATFNTDNGVAVSPAQLIFGTAQATQPVTFTNNTGARVSFGGATLSSARFSQTNNCANVAAGANCTMQVTYQPTNAGSDTGTLVISSTAHASPHGVALYASNTQMPRLANISTRMQSLTGANVMIGGFIIQGSTPKTIVVRARGPSLAQAGIYNNLADPQLQLFAGTTQIAFNNDWATAANATALQATGFAPAVSQEAAILTTLSPGAYSAVVTGVAGGTGVSIIEVFEVDHPESPLANISTRGQVRLGADVMIGGFIVQGNAPKTVVVRARGPSLAAAGVPGVLANPMLQLVRSSDGATIAVNDDWATASNVAQITSSGFAPPNALESAILMTLQPGAYTAIVTGVGLGTGVAIVEVFAQ